MISTRRMPPMPPLQASGPSRPDDAMAWLNCFGSSQGTVRNFVRRLGMMGAKEPTDAATQRADYS